ncbi:hypothetical protein [Cochlodiniinecator piscidefendens]|uniref:hypothetical protein n=1 Tax=Cochlodiniinecator piscidefendens TaxID=2715756 RepID=UPI00140B2799|nr:hypothetical protein [Cochlodiniinecator piscidefendens]
MQIAYHIGAHATDDDRLIKSLLKNKQMLQSHGVAVPGPSRYRQQIRETLASAANETPTHETAETLFRSIVQEDHVSRVILSGEHFICIPDRVFAQQKFYALADKRLPLLAQLAPSNEVEIHIATCNPAIFIPTVFAASNAKDFATFMQNTDPVDLHWSELTARMKSLVPGAKLVVWANEDTPVLWPRLLQSLSGLSQAKIFDGSLDMIHDVITPEGKNRLEAYLKSHPPKSHTQFQKILTAFLEKFEKEDSTQIEIDLPGWTDDLIDTLTTNYEWDLDRIQGMEGVTFITP